MNLRSKTYVLIVVLSLIAMLIAGMYLELIAKVIDYNHPPVNLATNQAISQLSENSEGNLYSIPVHLFSLFIKDPDLPVLSYPPPLLADKAAYPYPAAPSSAP
jgi:uncharacterized protein YneF (UPF0154 family)